jgi:hypothetical protein
MSQFSEKWARMSRQIDGYLGERVMLIPRLRGEYSEAQADGSRPAKTIKAVFSLRPQEAEAIDLGRHGGRLQGSSMIAVAPAALWIRAAVYDGLGYELEQGDQIALIDRVGQPKYTVARAPRNDVGDATVILTEDSP